MKILALHLPQFHNIKENDEWWGEGFTEWTNVKKAKPIYKGHMQPMIPLGNNYYDLTNPNALKWQADLAKRYRIDGFVYYHYWYSGKQMLEKPCEILLRHREISTSYCFCWANHPWTKAWDGKEHLILQKQTYGGKEEWEKHIRYFVKFFNDSRYIRINGNPVLFIYNASNIPDYDAMIEFWNRKLEEEGIEHLYIIEFISSKNKKLVGKHTQAVFEDEPIFSSRFEISNFLKAKRWICKKLNICDYLDYDYLWEKILRKKRVYDTCKIVRGAFCSFDNSPRRGKKGAFIVKNSSPEKFYIYFKQLLNNKRKNASQDLLIINAWNEWGETAMLEPSEQEKYGYLEAVEKAVREYEQ